MAYGNPGVYGTLGEPAVTNIPGGRNGAVSWTGNSGNFWQFGGYGFASNTQNGYLNDLWKFTAATNEWTWMGGSSTIPCEQLYGQSCDALGNPGVYGTLGEPAAANIPGSREGAVSWTDSSGNLWLWGGFGYDSAGTYGLLNDLWKFNPAINQWTWMSGTNTLPLCDCAYTSAPAVYGTEGTPAAGNVPPGSQWATGWTDGSGNLWLFGGLDMGYLNELWEFNPATSEWAWMGGSNTIRCKTYPDPNDTICGNWGVYGTLGMPTGENIPGGRDGAVSWTDSSGNLWLFGGYGFDAAGNPGDLNDLWEFSPSTQEWTWMSGTSTMTCWGGENYCHPPQVSSLIGDAGVYGTLGTPDPANVPGGRAPAANWIDINGNFWLFGGGGLDASGNLGDLNDIWVFNPPTSEWTWMGGSSTLVCLENGAGQRACGNPGVYGTLGTPEAANIPGSRETSASWVDSSGNFWLFGGLTNYPSSGFSQSDFDDLWVYQPASILPGAATPTFNVPAGIYTTDQTITISDSTPNATIYYTTNGTVPSIHSSIYGTPITVSSTETIEAIATATGFSTSATATVDYTITSPSAAVPSFSIPAGSYAAAQSVTISDTTPDAVIYYTTDDTTPTTSSNVYSVPITVSASGTLEAIATAPGYATSATATADYTISPSSSGTGDWTWMGGSNTVVPPCPNNASVCDLSGVYGTLGVFAAGNYPGGRTDATTWTESSGNLWLFGGYGSGFPFSGVDAILDDLWEFNPSTNQWAWDAGSNQVGSNSGIGDPLGVSGPGIWGWPGVYGVQGNAANGNIPGSRVAAASWTDGSGNLWLFGGSGLDGNNTWGLENDLWEFNPSTHQWAWMSGSSIVGSTCPASGIYCGQPGYYGVLGTPAAGNTPGGRSLAAHWTDLNGNFWLYGGLGLDSAVNGGLLNDLWKFNPSTKEWAWMGGINTMQCTEYGGGTSCGNPVIYGSLGIPALSNNPGGRYNAVNWTDSGGNFWLFGGDSGYDFEDLWEYNTFTNEWTWVAGINNGVQTGVYGTEGIFSAANRPGSRAAQSSWIDKSGNLWIFGGDGLDSSPLDDGGPLNDLWEYDPFLNEWAWMGGSTTIGSNCVVEGYCGRAGVYGAEGTPATANNPGSRASAASWTDISGNFWLFGGSGFDINGTSGALYDLWVYQPVPSSPAAATPTFSLPSGNYATTQPVTISDTTPNAVIYYTTDGTAPTVNSFLYSAPITVSSTETIEAIATATGYSNSGIATANYTINLPPTSNTLSASATNLTAGQALTLTATVTAGGSAVTPGQVNFCDAAAAYCTGIHVLGIAQLTSAGTATLKLIPAPGSHTYKAVFLGTNADAGSSSNEVTVTVAGSGNTATTTTIAQSGVPGNYTLTATVTGPLASSPSGMVSFLDTSNADYVLGTAELIPGATVTVNLWGFSVGSVAPTNPAPQSVAVGDFNGDGKLDLVVPNGTSNLTILLGNGDGTFSAAPAVPVAGNTVLRAVVGDFNGDGKADIAILFNNGNVLQVLLGNGDGSFTPLTAMQGSYTGGDFLAAGDFNGDGNADLVLENGSTNTLTILLGNGDGTFTPVSEHPATGRGPQSVAVGDFNGDGKPDLAIANSLDNSVTVLLGKGDGTFTPAAASPATGNDPNSITAGDFNGDGILDLAVTNYQDNTVTVLIGKGDGTFKANAVRPGVDHQPYSIAIGDFNGDGKTDLVMANASDNVATVLLGNGDGTFTKIWFVGAEYDPVYVAVGDFNGDGLSDLALADNNTNSVTILLAQPYDLATATATVTGISPVGTGTHLVDASYPGDSNYSKSISATTALTAEPVVTTLALSANPTSSTFGQQVLLTATLTPSQAQNHNASGKVTFYNGSTSLGTGEVSSGVATLSTTALPVGIDSVTAAYPGDTNFAASTSPAQSITVTAAEIGDWTWMGGSSTIGVCLASAGACGQPGVYGTLGAPAAGNIPGSRISPASWTDQNGHRWLFGGWGFDANGVAGELNDLWEFNPSTNQWAWMGGSSTTGIGCVNFNSCGWPGVYGALGKPAAGNIPGSRYYAATWVDKSGNFWLFGGYGLDVNSAVGQLNDLWEFNPSTKEWAWMSGSDVANAKGLYGTLSSPAAGDYPGGRMSASGWIDGAGNLWLFGGLGYDANGHPDYLNDLWEFNPLTKEWAWMAGNSTVSANCGLGNCSMPGVSGTLGKPSTGNIPEGRDLAAAWTDSGGNFWLFGGECFNAGSSGQLAALNDLWEFIPSSNEWAWMGGANTTGCIGGQPGVYGTLGVPAIGNIPAGRAGIATWTDGSGNFWLFGGWSVATGGIGVTNQVNDLWEFNPSTNEWAWMGGSDADTPLPGVYGTMGTQDAANIPGGRQYAASWTDGSGNIWLFGGLGWDSTSAFGYLNDVWKYGSAASLPPAATPTFNPPAGTYATAQTVAISDTTPGAIIYYAINGTPTTSSSVYSAPLTVSTSETIEAIATAPGYSTSAVATSAYIITPATCATNSLMNVAYYTIAESDQDENHSGGVSTNYVLPGLGANGLPVYNPNATATSGTIFVPIDLLSDGEITWWSPILNNGGPGGTSDVVETGTGTVSLPYANNAFFPPNGTGPNDLNGLQAAIFTGALFAPAAETVSFSISSDDMAFLYLDGQIACDDGGVHGPTAVPCTTSTISAGTHTLELFYVDLHPTQAVLDFSVTTSNVCINPLVTTTTALTASASTLTVGQTLTLTATVTAASGATPTGLVTFLNGAASLGTAQLDGNGVATLTLTPAVGSYSITASYGGSSTDTASVSSPATAVTVNLIATATALTASANTLTVGQSLTLTATVTAASGATPTGTVTFLNGTASLGSGSLNSSGVATLALTPAVGNYSISASYGGSSTDAASVSSPTTAVTVNAASTTTTLAVFPTTLSFGQTLTLTATVTAASGGTPTGTVNFLNGSNSLGSGLLNSSGLATLTLTPAVGSYSITASYAGSSTDAPSASSPPVIVTVTAALTTTTLTASPNPAPFGASVTFTATVATSTVTPIVTPAVTPMGSVSFYDSTALLGTATLVSGIATYSTSGLSVGSHNITATYAGTTNFKASNSNLVVEVISPADFSISVAPASRTVYTGEAAPYIVTITPGTGFNLPVTLFCSQLPANTTCDFSPSPVPAGGVGSALVVQTSAPSPATKTSLLSASLRVTALAGLLLLFIPRHLRRRNGWPVFLAIFALLAAGAFISGCGAPGPLSGGTPVGTQTVAITATATNGSQTLTHVITVTLNVKSLF